MPVQRDFDLRQIAACSQLPSLVVDHADADAQMIGQRLVGPDGRIDRDPEALLQAGGDDLDERA